MTRLGRKWSHTGRIVRQRPAKSTRPCGRCRALIVQGDPLSCGTDWVDDGERHLACWQADLDDIRARNEAQRARAKVVDAGCRPAPKERPCPYCKRPMTAAEIVTCAECKRTVGR